MSRLRVFGIISAVLLLNISFFFISEKVFAQSIDRQTALGQIGNQQGNYDYYSSQASSAFSAAINSLNQVRQTQQAAQNNPNKTQIIANIDAYISMVTEMEKTYTSTFNQNRSSGNTPAKTQIAALDAAEQRRLAIFNTFSASLKQEPTAQAVVGRVFLPGLSQLRLQATQIDRNIISAGSPEASSLGNAGAVTQSGNSVSSAVTANNASDCTLTNWSIPGCLSAGVTWLIKNTLLQIAGFLVWLTANMFNYAVQIGVLNFKDWAPDTLYPIWVIIRQIVSLLIVFAGLYLGLLYIIGNKEDNKFEKYIPWVIIFALFVNFSYPLARTAIDISNIISLNVYSSAVGNEALTADLSSRNTAGALIMERLGLQDLVLSATKTSESSNMLSGVNSIPGALIAVVFVFYAAYIFFMVTAIMVIRTVSLVFITIASPLLFVDSVLPLLGDKAQQLRKIFFEQLAVGPVFMIMLALTLKFLEVFSRGPVNLGQVAGANSSTTITTFFNILMMLIMLHIMIKVTKLTAGSLGQYATDAMGKVGGFGLGVAAGGAGLLARKGIGGLAMKARDSKWVTNNQDSFLGRRAYDMSNSLAKSTFDLRNSKVVAGRMEKIGMGMGMGTKLGYEAEAQAKRMDLVERGSRIKTRYERDIFDPKTGEILHRKGDINEEGSRAQTRFVANGGGALFMGKDERQLAREAIGNKVNEENKKRIESTLNSAKPDIELYNKGTKEERAALKADLESELKREEDRIRAANPNIDKNADISHLMGDQAQAIQETLKVIREKEGAEKKQIDELLFKYNNFSGTPEEVSKKQGKLLEGMNKETKEAFTKAQTEMLSATQAAKVAQVGSAPTTAQVGSQAQKMMSEKSATGETSIIPDVDLTQKSTQTLAKERREQKQVAAIDVVNQSFKDLIKKRPQETPAPAPATGEAKAPAPIPPRPTPAPASSNEAKFVSKDDKGATRPATI